MGNYTKRNVIRVDEKMIDLKDDKYYTLVGWRDSLAIVLPNLSKVLVEVAMMDAKIIGTNYHTVLEHNDKIVMYKSKIHITHKFEIVEENKREVEKDDE